MAFGESPKAVVSEGILMTLLNRSNAPHGLVPRDADRHISSRRFAVPSKLIVGIRFMEDTSRCRHSWVATAETMPWNVRELREDLEAPDPSCHIANPV